MKIDGQFYLCEGCGEWQPFMGEDVSCDCGHSNDFTEDEIEALQIAVDEIEFEEKIDDDWDDDDG